MRPIRSTLVLAMSAMLLAGAVSPVAAGTEPVRFKVDIGERCLSGSATPGLAFRLLQVSDTGTIVRDVDVVATGGAWADCDGPAVTIGQTLRARKSGATIHQLVVPALTLSPRRANDLLRGTAPPGDSVDFTLQHCYPGSSGCDSAVTIAPKPVDGSGHFAVDVSGEIDLVGGDLGIVHWQAPLGDDVRARMDVPAMNIRTGRAAVLGTAQPGTSVTIRLFASDDALRGWWSAAVSSAGVWNAKPRHDGVPVAPHVGDRITASFASDASLTLRATGLTADLGAHTLTGTCQPDGEVGVRVQKADFSNGQSKHTLADGSGDWSLPGWTMLQHGSRVDVWCATPAGDVQTLTRTIP